MGLHQATSGSIYMNGRQIDPYVDRRAVHPVMQMVFQNPYASLNPRLTVNAILEEPLELDPKYTPRDRVIRVKEVLDQVGLNMSFGERYAHELSGGNVNVSVLHGLLLWSRSASSVMSRFQR